MLKVKGSKAYVKCVLWLRVLEGLAVKLKKYAAKSGTKKLVKAHNVAGPQKELVKSKKRSGIFTSYGPVPKSAIDGIVNAYLSARSSFRKL